MSAQLVGSAGDDLRHGDVCLAVGQVGVDVNDRLSRLFEHGQHLVTLRRIPGHIPWNEPAHDEIEVVERVQYSEDFSDIPQHRLASLIGAMVNDVEQIRAVTVVGTSARHVDSLDAGLIVEGYLLRADIQRPFNELCREAYETAIEDVAAAFPEYVERCLIEHSHAALLHYLNTCGVEGLQLFGCQSFKHPGLILCFLWWVCTEAGK